MRPYRAAQEERETSTMEETDTATLTQLTDSFQPHITEPNPQNTNIRKK